MGGLIISGMHHSGTSVVARLLSEAGWNPGTELLPDDPVNGKNFVEDAEFVALNQTWLSFNNPDPDTPGDWGVSRGRAVSHIPSLATVESAREYCAKRQRSSENWLAKDPRSSLTLGTWSRVSDIRFLVIYRNPWDVVESLMRYGQPFTGRSDWAFSVWKAYNQRLLDFIDEVGSRVMVVASSAALAQPRDFADRIATWADKPLSEFNPRDVVDPALYRDRKEGSHISRVFQILHPEASNILNRLDDAAEFPREKIPQRTTEVFPGGGSRKWKAIHVILPCRNDGQFLAESISSVEEAASMVDIPVELTIIDSASDDITTIEYFSCLRNAGYQIIRANKAGLSFARNAGLKKSRARAVIPLDADNRLLSPIMTAALKILDGEADVVFGPWRRFGMDKGTVSPPENIDWSSFIPHNTVDACAPTSRKLLKRLGGWEEDLPALEDWDLWIRALQKKARFQRIEDVMFEYCVRPGSMLWKMSESIDKGKFAIDMVVERHKKWLEEADVDVSDWG